MMAVVVELEEVVVPEQLDALLFYLYHCLEQSFQCCYLLYWGALLFLLLPHVH